VDPEAAGKLSLAFENTIWTRRFTRRPAALALLVNANGHVNQAATAACRRGKRIEVVSECNLQKRVRTLSRIGRRGANEI
jgi:hypothetical protein